MPESSDLNEVVSVVLVPEGKDSDIFYRLSTMIPGSLFKLDEKHIPHITIAQFLAPFSQLSRLENEMIDLNGRACEVVFGGLNFVPDTSRDETWVELTVLKSEHLLNLQKRVLGTQFAKDFELQNRRVDDTYRPHMTLGLLKGSASIPEIDLKDTAAILRRTVNVKVAVGKNGEFFSFVG